MIKLNCTSGIVQTFASVEEMTAQYGNNYGIRNGNELWHKGHNYKAGVFFVA